MNNLINFIIRNYKFVLIVILLVSIPFVYFNTKQKFDHQIEIFFEKDDPDLNYYKKFRKAYGNEEMGIIVFKDKNIFTNENIDIIRKISGMLKKIKGVQRVFSITEQKEAVYINDTLYFNKIIPPGFLKESALNAIRKKVLSNKVMLKRFISIDGTTSAIMMELKPTKNIDEKTVLIQNISKTANGIAEGKIDLHFAGTPYFQVEMTKLTQKDMRTLVPIAAIIIFIIVILMLRNFKLSILCMADLGITVIIALGLFIMFGESLNVVTNMLPGILLAIAVASSIHLLAHYKDEYTLNGKDHIGAVTSATKAVWIPCLFTSLTTAVGFFSFISSSLRPPKILGIFTAMGVMIAFIITVTFLPAMLVFLRKSFTKSNLPKAQQKKSTDHEDSVFTKMLLRIGNFSTGNSKAICFTFLLVLILTIIGVFKITFETNIITFFPEDSNIKTDLKFVEKNLGGGTFTSEYIILAKSKEFDFTHPDSLRKIEEIQNHLMNDTEHYASSFSIADYIKEINRAFKWGKDKYYKIPETRTDILDYYELGDTQDLERIISPDRMETRLSLHRYNMSNEKGKIIQDQTIAYMKNKLGENLTFKKTGMISLFLSMNDNLKNSFIRSFLIAFVIIFFMMLYICKNIKLSIISMIPNLFPIFLTIGFMGWLNIPMNTVTVMIASVALGIAVDDTIHFLVWFKRNVSTGLDIKSSLLMTYKNVGKPIVATSVVLFLGFSILFLGSMTPVKTFGALTAFSILFALISDLLLLPALIIVFKPKFDASTAWMEKIYQVNQLDN